MKNENIIAAEQPKMIVLQKNITPTNIAITVLLLVLGYATLAQAHQNPFVNQNTIEQPALEQSPTPTIKPSIKPTAKPNPTSQPTSFPTPRPLQPITCSSTNCGSFKPEDGMCADYICCSLPEGGYKALLIADCQKIKDEDLKKRQEEANKIQEEKLKIYKDAVTEQTKAYQERVAKQEAQNKADDEASKNASDQAYVRLIESNASSYLSCISQARQWYAQQQAKFASAGGVFEGEGFGSFKSTVEDPYQNYLSQCDVTYQPRK